MYPNIGVSAIDLSQFENVKSVTDAVYNPLSSALVISARERGINATGGLYMLVSQAAHAVEKFTGGSISADKTEEVYREILRDKRILCL